MAYRVLVYIGLYSLYGHRVFASTVYIIRFAFVQVLFDDLI